MSLVTILPCIFVGGSIVPFIKETDKIFLLQKIIKENKVSVLTTVPSFMMVLNYQIKRKLKIDKIVLGENFSLNIFKIVKNKFNF